MANNVQALLAGVLRWFKTTEVDGVHTPHHIAERDPADPMLGLVGQAQQTPDPFSIMARLSNLEGYTDGLEGDIARIRAALENSARWKTSSDGVPTSITTNTTTLVKTGAGSMLGIAINKPGTTEVLTIYDGLSASGIFLGAPAIQATDTYREFPAIFGTGLTIVSSGAAAGDFTVFWL